ncbi:hypothetical protein BJ912DRAFT_999525 [Pholiota molesta]|nr:hypothetical protein BJ912DRAFT_999525 [Pholiota molesta]
MISFHSLADCTELSLPGAIYATLTEGHNARRALERPTQCLAKYVINSLQMQYNCGRKAPIMNELVDIISDIITASAL